MFRCHFLESFIFISSFSADQVPRIECLKFLPCLTKPPGFISFPIMSPSPFLSVQQGFVLTGLHFPP